MDLVLGRLGVRDEEAFFWATHAGAELDLLVVRGTTRLGFEFKRREAPRLTPSMRHARDDLRLDRLTVIHAGPHDYSLADRVEALGLARAWTKLSSLA